MKGGVLIIGSLLWQDDLNIDRKDKLRKKWRDKHLVMENKLAVKTSIRYGRFSEKGGIFTMVFSTSCINRKCGTAFIVPLKAICESYIDIEKEATALAVAEGMKGNLIARKADGEVWSVLSFLTNPGLSKDQRNMIGDGWKSRIILEGGYNPLHFKLDTEKPCIDRNGKLNIKWPVPVDTKFREAVNSYDFLLATATKPTMYPSAKNHITKIIADKKRKYFLSNHRNGISTFNDAAVIKQLPKELLLGHDSHL